MADLLTVKYAQSGTSARLDELGMREMQARAYQAREAQYLLIKAPPASGKSRALMFIGLDKLHHQGLQKVVVAVPEMSIGRSFKDADLSDHGFFADWCIDPHYNLCIPGGEKGKTERFAQFMADESASILVCTHATLRFAYEHVRPSDFDNAVVAIDEFHHTSANEDNRLGALIDSLMRESKAHIIAMTGSYFRGDAVPILLPEDEEQFVQVTYSYYEQLNGYRYLKSLGIGYHFYQGEFFDAVGEVLDRHKKTLIHIPSVNARESTKDKYNEVGRILDLIGRTLGQDADTGIISIKTEDGRTLKVADLVDDSPIRDDTQLYLREISRPEDVDIIIALGMAKEGFDWPWCEHVLTIGYRSSLTEIIQIIGRATRDCEGKTHAQFTNLIAQPDAADEDVRISVNNMLKAITVSLLMEQVLAPSISFTPRSRLGVDEEVPAGTLVIEDGDSPVSDTVLNALSNMDSIKAALLQQPSLIGPAVTTDEESAGAVLREIEIPKVVERLYPGMTAAEIETVSSAVHASMVIQSTGGLFDPSDLPEGAEGLESDDSLESAEGRQLPRSNGKFVLVGSKFINIEQLNMDLIRHINPFRGAYEIVSKAVTPAVLKTIQDVVVGMRSHVTDAEAVVLWPRILEFRRVSGCEPSPTASSSYERRLAEALAYVKRKYHERQAANQG